MTIDKYFDTRQEAIADALEVAGATRGWGGQ
jgi:hypothetical protein